jgi:hypothetical protein
MSQPIANASSIVQTRSADLEKKEIVVDRNADLGLQLLAKHGRTEYTEQQGNAVRWKIDLLLMPGRDVFSEAVN